MMRLRDQVIAARHGLKYIVPFKRFALRAREDGLTFASGSAKGRERIMGIRYFTQRMGIALVLSSKKMGLDRLLVNPLPFLRRAELD